MTGANPDGPLRSPTCIDQIRLITVKNFLRMLVSGLALAGAGTQVWSQDTFHERIFASQEWREFRDKVISQSAPRVTEAQLRALCRRATTTGVSDATDTAVQTCLRAAADGLGPSTAYFTPEERRRIEAGPDDFVGVGLELRQAASRN